MPHSAPPLRTWLLTGTLLAALPVLSGCIVAAAGAGAAGGYAVLGQEESPGDQLKDKTIAAQVAQSWEQYSRDLAHDLDDTVYQQRVLITGRVPSEEMHQEAVKRAWRVGNVKEVHDEIEVGPETHFSDQARDTVISTRLRTDLLADSNVKSINYTIKTENGVVYVIGSARSQAELNRVTDYARNIPNVRRVVSYVRIRGGEPSAAPTAASAAPAAASAAPPPAAASATPPPQDTQPTPPTPRGSIEVTPLK